MGSEADKVDQKGVGDMMSRMMLTQEQCEAIGCVAFESARLEAMFDYLLWDLLGLDSKSGPVVTAKAQFKGKVEMFYGLAKLKDEAVAAAFKSLFDAISEAIAKRRVVIHGHWEIMEKGAPIKDYIQALVARDGSMEAAATLPKKQAIRASEVMAIALDFSRLHDELIQFLARHTRTWK